MQAVEYASFSTDASNVQLVSVPVPTATPGNAVVKVHVAAINPVDVMVLNGALKGAWETPLPFRMGYDFSGVVTALPAGEDARGFSVGDDVFAVTWGKGSHYEAGKPTGGAFAEYILVPLERLSKKPAGVSHAQAAAVALVGLTAYQNLFEIGRVAAGSRVLILGGSTAVGAIATQLAKNAGAWVAVTASARNIAYAASFGPDRVIDYTSTKWETEVADLDFVFDTAGEAGGFAKAKGIIKPGGAFVSIANHEVGHNPTAHAPLRFASFTALHYDSAQQDTLAAQIDAGRLRVPLDEAFPFTQAGVKAIIAKISGGKSRGKNLLVVSA